MDEICFSLVGVLQLRDRVDLGAASGAGQKAEVAKTTTEGCPEIDASVMVI